LTRLVEWDEQLSRLAAVLAQARSGMGNIALGRLSLMSQVDVWPDGLCRGLVDPHTRHVPMLQAELAAVSAEIAMRRGDFAMAFSQASAALERVSPPAWGIAVSRPRYEPESRRRRHGTRCPPSSYRNGSGTIG
jgi:hypothetical protein